MTNISELDIDKLDDLQSAIDSLYLKGIRKIKLHGNYVAKTPNYSILTINKKHTGLELSGKAVLDGNDIIPHVLVINNAEVVIKDLVIQKGNTQSARLVAKNYKGSKFKSIYEAIDGAGVLILGESKVKFKNVEFSKNKSGMCGGALSNQGTELVTIEGCVFKDNLAYHTGSAIDNLTPGSMISISSSKFINNLSNNGSLLGGPHGQITIFGLTKAVIKNCSFKGQTYPINSTHDSSIDEANNTWNDKLIKSRKSGGQIKPISLISHFFVLIKYELLLIKHGLYPKVRNKVNKNLSEDY